MSNAGNGASLFFACPEKSRNVDRVGRRRLSGVGRTDTGSRESMRHQFREYLGFGDFRPIEYIASLRPPEKCKKMRKNTEQLSQSPPLILI